MMIGHLAFPHIGRNTRDQIDQIDQGLRIEEQGKTADRGDTNGDQAG